MIIRPTPTFAPDGFGGSRQHRDAGLFAAVAAATAGQRSEGSASGESASQHQRHYHLNHHDGYDDGLVHSHGWAASE